MSKNAYFVTGAAGFIGFHVAKALLERKETVIGYDNISDYYDIRLKELRLGILRKYENFTFFKGDLCDLKALDIVINNFKPRTIIHLAAQAGVRYSIENPQAYIDSNVVGFFNILEVCRNIPIKHLVYASSSSVYGNQEKIPFSITDFVDKPISLYAATKKANELMAYTYSHLYGIPTTGLRFFTVYGPYGRPDMAYFKFADKITAGEPIQVFNNGDMLRDFTYIDDIAEGVLKVSDVPPKPDENGVLYKLYNIGNNKPVRLLRFISVLEDALGKQAEIEYLPMQAGDVYKTYADITDLENDFGFRPKMPIEEGLTKFADWYKTYRKL